MASPYSVKEEAAKLFKVGILENPLLRVELPVDIDEAASKVTFVGSDEPTLPINWRFAESISALKALEATVLGVLIKKRYGVGPFNVTINTDHAQLFIMSGLIWVIDPDGADPVTPFASPLAPLSSSRHKRFALYFPGRDMYLTTHYRNALTNIFNTEDDKYYHIHGDMSTSKVLQALKLGVLSDFDRVLARDAQKCALIVQVGVIYYTASELDDLVQSGELSCGTICHTTTEYLTSPHGRANALKGLFEIEEHPSSDGTRAPCWWQAPPSAGPSRPLEGLRVLDLTRMPAGQLISRGLAELGARVMRVTADKEPPDHSMLAPDLNHGKWTCQLDLWMMSNVRRLELLVSEADVVVQSQGFAPWAFWCNKNGILKKTEGRERGIIICEVNCYGWQGEWKDRNGWQPLSDACTGVSWEFGRAMGRDEPITPVFPNADYCTGVAGTIGVLTALIRQADEGGSFVVRTSLNYYNQWLIDACGTYPQKEVWTSLRDRYNHQFRHYHNMLYTIPRVLTGISKDVEASKRLFPSQFFVKERPVSLRGKEMLYVAPVLQFPQGEVKPGFDIGTRGNAVDDARWPEDMNVQVVEPEELQCSYVNIRVNMPQLSVLYPEIASLR
ncbi:CAIB/BAIF family protein [Echria macrotheca]|uniref:CAIB/BAIF family protein n=1 Tax=Echria macrotheca TaxID=438768 RepID=A0AAJ0BID1_9PEZI|nr:CAIB/BAIF family protein [Echria macrotheca]